MSWIRYAYAFELTPNAWSTHFPKWCLEGEARVCCFELPLISMRSKSCNNMCNLHCPADINKYRTYKELALHINRNVRAIVGPHGGGLMNLIWAAR